MIENALNIFVVNRTGVCVCEGDGGDYKLALTGKSMKMGKGFQ